MSSTPPQTLGKYQIIREIARSNDIVYEAYDALMNRRVALKELSMPGGSTTAQKEERIKRFLREARAAGSLTHPNIMTVFEVGEEGGRYFIAMEYLDGHTLRNELDTHGSLAQDQAIAVAREVLEGLHYMHDHGVIHRDIKPDNIQLLSDGRVKLTDFGIARLTFEPNLTMDGQVFGTPSYMSPEQVVGREIDARSDLFSVGVVLYEMLAGAKPFPGDSVVSITYAITNKQPEHPPSMPYVLWQIVERALDKSPSMRPASASAMLALLDDAERNVASGAMGAAPVAAPPTLHGAPYPTQGNPYGLAQGIPMPPPVIAPYNPYGQQPAVGQQTLAGVPVYYPPPPRKPLFKPETKRFFARLFATLVILGTLFVLIIAGINAISTIFDQQRQRAVDQRVRDGLVVDDSSKPLDDRIQEREQGIGRLQGEVAIKDENRNLAILYRQMGHKEKAGNHLAAALASFQKASELDPLNAMYHDDLGSVYAQAAQTYPEPRQRLESWQAAARSWQNAYRLATGSNRQQYGENAATALVNAASALERSDPILAREHLYMARTLAAPGGQAALAAEEILDRLTR